MDDRELNRELRALPRAHAPPGFTGRVLARLEPAPSRSRGPGRMMALATALLLLAAVALPLAVWRYQAQRRASIEHEIAALRAEQEALRVRLGTIQRQVDRTPTIVYLGGDDQVDYVIDLDWLLQAKAQSAPRGAHINSTGGSL